MRPDFVSFVAALVVIANTPILPGQAPGASSSHAPTVLRVWGAGNSELLLTLDRLETAYSAMNPDTHFDNQLRGNDSALGGLYVGAADVAFMTREPSYIELDGYQQMIQGQTPLEIEVMRGGPNAHGSLSPLVLVVNSANPLASVDIPNLKAIFAISHSTVLPTVSLWKDLGVEGSQGRRPIHLYGFDTESEEAATFSVAALGDHPRWVCSYRAAPDTPNAASQISQEVQHDLDGLGLTTLDAVGPHIKVLKIAGSGGAISPTPEALGSGEYVLGRTVFVLARKTSEGYAEPAVRGFLAFLLSNQGQAILGSDGALLPLGASLKKAASEALK